MTVAVAVVLLGGVCVVTGMMVLTFTYYALVDRLRAYPPGHVPGNPYMETSAEVAPYFFLLLAALVLLVWATSRALHGGREGRIGLWISAVPLSLGPLQIAFEATTQGFLQWETIILIIAVVMAAQAALLLALPTTNAFYRRAGADPRAG
ncbi:hypothetical protein [Actinomadura sp. 9N407]|uniref:hypothetical protein n=1 Tax=Actinomadura sp. 9N407 TaxID=3375154 RepID=UPI0037B9BFFC